MRYYTGVGSRKTPPATLELFTKIAARLRQLGWTLRSGGAGGADLAFESGAGIDAQIFIPWYGFNGREDNSNVTGHDPKAQKIAAEIHPAWDRCSVPVRKLHARNVHQVLGRDLKSPSEFLICWTPGGQTVGGTATSIRLAQNHGVPVFNIGDPQNLERFYEWIREQ